MPREQSEHFTLSVSVPFGTCTDFVHSQPLAMHMHPAQIEPLSGLGCCFGLTTSSFDRIYGDIQSFEHRDDAQEDT